MATKRLGIIINPFAGAGGRLGWKGTDWPLPLKLLDRKVDLVAPRRARSFHEEFRRMDSKTLILAPPGIMGWESLQGRGGPSETVDCVKRGKWPTTPEDTLNCARMIVDYGVDLLVFVGGDGTARLIHDAVDKRVPVLGVPAGVKVYSAVFAYTPREAAIIAFEFLKGRGELVEREVLDIDEEAFRQNKLVVKLYGYLRVPRLQGLVASGKTVSHGVSEEDEMEEIADYFLEEHYRDCTLYVFGPGRTVAKIAEKLGVSGKTLLGVDVVHNRRIIAKDVDEETLYRIVSSNKGRVKIVVSPIGGQGFIFGRGNQQISPRVLELVDKEDIIVVSTPSKLRALRTLRIDTGSEKVDARLRGYMRVLTGYGRYRLMRVE
ncbi:MAG: ATP-NAD kinase family protein [Desulfurococcales archaeon]|nr:ATP-NAD kinase family protein [Desulfurococcales archaeon]